MAKHTLENELYRYHLKVTGVTEYGVDFGKLAAGEVAPPAAGARFDIWVEGTIDGKVQGMIKGCDYLYVRADGRMELNVYCQITTTDGASIALEASGVATPVAGTPTLRLMENVKLFTSHDAYLWLNGLQIWAPGMVNLADGTVELTGYAD